MNLTTSSSLRAKTTTTSKMSGGLDVLALKEEDVVKFIACSAHLGANQCDFQMEQYCYKRKADGQYIIHLKTLWEKLLLAALSPIRSKRPSRSPDSWSSPTPEPTISRLRK